MNHPKPMPPIQPHRPHQPLLPVEHSLSPELTHLLTRFLTILESRQMTEQELKDYFDAKTQETVDAIKATVATEHDEVLAAIAALGSKQGLTDDQIKAAVDAHVATIKEQAVSAVQGVFDAAPVPPTP